MIRAYERRTNPMYANPREYRVNQLLNTLSCEQDKVKGLTMTLVVVATISMATAILAVPTLINLLTRGI